MSFYARIAAAAAMLTLLAGLSWKLHHSGYVQGKAEVQAQWDQANAQQQARNDALALQRSTRVLEAQNAQIAHQQSIDADARRARVALHGLRESLDLRARTAGQPTDAGPEHCPAERELLSASSQALEHVASELVRVAKEADGHAADSLMYQQAWPQ